MCGLFCSQLLKKVYIEDKQWQGHPEVTGERIQFTTELKPGLNATTGPGWTASIEGTTTVSVTTESVSINECYLYADYIFTLCRFTRMQLHPLWSAFPKLHSWKHP